MGFSSLRNEIAPGQLAIEKLQQDREYLLRQLPGAKTAEDQSVISQVASEVVQRLQTLSFDESRESSPSWTFAFE